MTPGPGQFAVTIRIDRADGQFVTSTCLVPSDLLTRPEPDLDQQAATYKITDGFVQAYRRAVELPEERTEMTDTPVSEIALAEARRQGFSPATKPADREPVIRRLQEAGCTREEIAGLFGVNRERIGRQITAMRARERSR